MQYPDFLLRLDTTLRKHQSLAAWALTGTLLLLVATRLAAMFTAPLPPLPALPAPPVKKSPAPRTLPDLFQSGTKTSAYAVTRWSADDPQLYNAPRSSLSLQVSGILSSSNPLKSHAIINSGQQQFMVSVNDILDGTPARVIRIFPDRIILAHQGRYESLVIAQEAQTNSL